MFSKPLPPNQNRIKSVAVSLLISGIRPLMSLNILSKSNASGTFGQTVKAGNSKEGTRRIVVDVAVGPETLSLKL